MLDVYIGRNSVSGILKSLVNLVDVTVKLKHTVKE